MPTYAYRCGACGPFDAVRPMATSSEPTSCPGCGTAGRRVITGPAFRRVSAGLSRALAASERSADAPAVVRTVPPRPHHSNVTTDPRHAALPRP